jgi:hypothetical protein
MAIYFDDLFMNMVISIAMSNCLMVFFAASENHGYPKKPWVFHVFPH